MARGKERKRRKRLYVLVPTIGSTVPVLGMAIPAYSATGVVVPHPSLSLSFSLPNPLIKGA